MKRLGRVSSPMRFAQRAGGREGVSLFSAYGERFVPFREVVTTLVLQCAGQARSRVMFRYFIDKRI